MYRGSMRLTVDGAGKVEESDVKGFDAKVQFTVSGGGCMGGARVCTWMLLFAGCSSIDGCSLCPPMLTCPHPPPHHVQSVQKDNNLSLIEFELVPAS